MLDPGDVLAERWPTGGPHDRGTVRSAADAVPTLVRYLANATDPVNARATLETAGDVDHIVVSLLHAVGHLPQVLDQVGRRLSDLAAIGGLRDDRLPDEPPMGRETAYEVMSALSEVRPAINFLLGQLAAVRTHSRHLETAARQLRDRSSAGGGPR